METQTLWPLVDTIFFWRTFQVLDDSQETFDVLSALAYRVSRAAADTPRVPNTSLRMLKSRRHVWEGRLFRPIRLWFAFDEKVQSVLLTFVEEEDELDAPAREA